MKIELGKKYIGIIDGSVLEVIGKKKTEDGIYYCIAYKNPITGNDCSGWYSEKLLEHTQLKELDEEEELDND